jgi:hypothetical protein
LVQLSPAVFQLLLFDREDCSLLDLNVGDGAVAAAGVNQSGVIATGLNACNGQSLAMVDFPVLVVRALVGTPLIFPAGERYSSFTVFAVRFQNLVLVSLPVCAAAAEQVRLNMSTTSDTRRMATPRI